ncbi:MAG: DNA cytosine methyltransferase, partial [Methanobrevibacter sp.]|nr:DNA cytosine methyltransferase [Methanobrevibacter sp.]
MEEYEQLGLFDEEFPKYEINKPIRLIELFAGISAQSMALKRLGVDFERYRAIEFDEFAMKSYNAICGTDFKPTDICDIHAADLGITEKDKYEYIMFYSFPCLTGDTFVLTDKGLKCIKDVTTEDLVLTHNNKYEKVIASRKTGTKNIYRIKGMGIDEIRCTENHRFLVREMYRTYPRLKNGKRAAIRYFKEAVWKECKDLTKKDYLGIAINQKSELPKWEGITFEWADGRMPRVKNVLSALMNNHSFWWLIGRYLGDGWTRTGGIIICCAKDETMEILPHVRNCGFNYCISKERTVNKIHITLSEIEKFVNQFGHGAANKKLPSFIFDMPCDLLESLLEGYISADGYVKNGIYKIASISRELIYGMAQVVAKVHKTPYRIYKNKRNPNVIIEGRVCNQKDGYELVFKTEKKKQDKAFYEDGYIWFPIQSVTNTHTKEDVYDIEVENAHSFTANGVIVHNCTDLSLAGRQAGMSRDSGTRSGLLWEVERLLKECGDNLPQVLVMENVIQVHSEKNLPDFEEWIQFLRSKGYSNFYGDLNAKDFGVPQNRDRCFMVSMLGKYDFQFPKTIPLEKV